MCSPENWTSVLWWGYLLMCLQLKINWKQCTILLNRWLIQSIMHKYDKIHTITQVLSGEKVTCGFAGTEEVYTARSVLPMDDEENSKINLWDCLSDMSQLGKKVFFFFFCFFCEAYLSMRECLYNFTEFPLNTAHPGILQELWFSSYTSYRKVNWLPMKLAALCIHARHVI